MRVRVEAPPELEPLPAAVEVAAYRIVQEALANAARHSSARRCIVRLALDGALELEVRDDGVGVPEGHRTGVGLQSMRERAAELGGTFVVERADGGGTVVHARLPLLDAAADQLNT
jgi:two-component system NarL family sensor kinase